MGSDEWISVGTGATSGEAKGELRGWLARKLKWVAAQMNTTSGAPTLTRGLKLCIASSCLVACAGHALGAAFDARGSDDVAYGIRSAANVHPGATLWVGLPFLRILARKPIHVTRLQFACAPDRFQVTGIYVLSILPAGKHITVLRDADFRRYIGGPLGRAETTYLDSRTNDRYVGATVTFSRPGNYHITGATLSYKDANGDQGTQTMRLDIQIAIV